MKRTEKPRIQKLITCIQRLSVLWEHDGTRPERSIKEHRSRDRNQYFDFGEHFET